MPRLPRAAATNSAAVCDFSSGLPSLTFILLMIANTLSITKFATPATRGGQRTSAIFTGRRCLREISQASAT